MVSETRLLQDTRSFAECYLQGNAQAPLYYHNLTHTKDVVDAVIEIGTACKLNNEQMETVLVAAWLHDLGYYHGCDNHENNSIQMSRKFLEGKNVPDEKIKEVVDCIAATKIPQKPANLLQKVICDADLYHLASEKYFDSAELLRKEISTFRDFEVSKDEWFEMSFQFMKAHNFFTDYAKENLTARKEENLKKVEEKLYKDKQLIKLEKENQKLKIKLEKISQKKPERGIETMFRTTSKNHVDLSSIADNKANIMISINSIIISILVTVLIRKFEDFPNLIIPTMILTLVCLLTIVFAILATRPNVSSGRFTKEDILNKKTNLLFFGNFHRMQLKDYEWGVKEIMKDSEYLYSSMIRDIYFLGKVLGRKYRLLRISYTIFMYGFVISVLSYAISMVFFRY